MGKIPFGKFFGICAKIHIAEYKQQPHQYREYNDADDDTAFFHFLLPFQLLRGGFDAVQTEGHESVFLAELACNEYIFLPEGNGKGGVVQISGFHLGHKEDPTGLQPNGEGSFLIVFDDAQQFAGNTANIQLRGEGVLDIDPDLYCPAGKGLVPFDG